MADDPVPDDFKKFEQEARAYFAARNRERQEGMLSATTRTRPALDRPDYPLKAHERHQQENAAAYDKRLQGVPDPALREQAKAQIGRHYEAWGRAPNRVYNQRYDNSDRIYERKLTASKTDARLIPRNEKQAMRGEAIREAVTLSNNRIKEINGAMAQMIVRTIDGATVRSSVRKAGLDTPTQRAKDVAADYKARAARAGRSRGERDLEK